MEGTVIAYRRGNPGDEEVPTPRPESELAQLLREKYGLTNKETEIAIRLIQNERQAAVVEELNISQNTLKTHRRRIYEKLGVLRQIDLVAEGHRLWTQARKNYGQG
ncbi:helix-turn-helix transcriptional regulator [Parvibaculum sp. MBR-TMA-1.3b-4.2]